MAEPLIDAPIDNVDPVGSNNPLADQLASNDSPTDPPADPPSDPADSTPADPPATDPPSDPPTDGDPPADPPERIVPDADKYELPDGMPQEMGQFANENDFTQEQLTAAIQKFGGIMVAAEKAAIDGIRAQGEEHVKTWGDARSENMALVNQGLAAGDPDGKLKDILVKTGYVDHPAVLDFMKTIGGYLKEGGFQPSNPRPTKEAVKKTAATALFPNHPSEQDTT